MAIYHARVKTFSRAKGHSSVAAAAYRAGRQRTETAGPDHPGGSQKGSLQAGAFHRLSGQGRRYVSRPKGELDEDRGDSGRSHERARYAHHRSD